MRNPTLRPWPGGARFSHPVATRSHRTTPPAVGDTAPPLSLPTLDGGHYRLEDHRERPVLVSFLRHAG